MSIEPAYGSPKALESAIKDAAKRESRINDALSISDLIRMEYRNRLLCRVFGSNAAENWILKGGTSLLARVADTRSTQDLDLFRRGVSLDSALEELKELAEVDLGDYFTFVYTGHRPTATGEQQGYVEGLRVSFDIYIGATKRGSLGIDLVTNSLITDDVDARLPASTLQIRMFQSVPYRLYPIVDQIADKVCATLARYSGRESSRQKDLVDLVVIALTHEVDSAKLGRALTMEAEFRNLTLPNSFQTPNNWGRQYAQLASKVPTCRNHKTINAAKSLMADFIDPVLNGSARGRTWDYRSLSWLDPT